MFVLRGRLSVLDRRALVELRYRDQAGHRPTLHTPCPRPLAIAATRLASTSVHRIAERPLPLAER